jgi:hypothetical protein
LNVHGINDVRQTEIQTAEPLRPESSAFEVEKANEKLKRHTSQDTDQHPAELIESGGRAIYSKVINLLIPFGVRKNCLRSGRSR